MMTKSPCGQWLAAAILAWAGATAAGPATAAGCAPGALGTSRTLAVDAATTPRVGLKSFPQTLPLADKEVVLTFDDGPFPATTARVLTALAGECVKATFFLIGRNAQANPEMVRRIDVDGHTIGHHTWSHRLLNRLREKDAWDEIDRGIAADEAAFTVHGSGAAPSGRGKPLTRHTTGGASGASSDGGIGKAPGPASGAAGETPSAVHRPATPFFRFPGFASSPRLLDELQQRRFVVFGADLWASDWNVMSPEAELALITQRLAAQRKGIILFHDTKQSTARMLPAFLRWLKTNGYKVVHVVAGEKRAEGE
jgi:peptidoglycan/xylan/chitin deacetylase (PgdA/CDA1 family)